MAALMLAATLGYSQIDMGNKTKPESSTQGIFVKNGTMKLTSLDCYDFDDMAIAFDIDDSFFTYDVIQVQLAKGKNGEANQDNIYRYNFTKEEFARKFKGKKYAFLNLFPEQGLDKPSVMGFTRARLQLVYSKKDKETTVIYVRISGGTKTGVTSNYDNYSNRVVYKDTYTYDKLTSLAPVPMHNAFVARAFLSDPTMPTATGNCYK